MNRYVSFLILFFLFTSSNAVRAQQKHTDANIFGHVKSSSDGEHIPFATVFIEGTTTGTTTDETGHYMLIDLKPGTHILVAKSMGYTTVKDTVEAVTGESREVNFILDELIMDLKEVVITGTKTFKRQTESAVIVNVLESKALDITQSCNISEGLRFQPGLRVETDCQTCNYTQLRMNGLGGGYSQILINGRPIFSPLVGLYGMEQIPANMVERIEVVRGGGSALYGSSAIGGTVNIITKIPQTDSYDFSVSPQLINGEATDVILNGNLNVLTNKRNAGGSIFINRRNREAYDHNNDNFSELPELKNNSFGANLFFKPDPNQKIEINLTSLNEYRYGGEVIKDPAYLALQSEERTHNVLMGGIDYQVNFNEDNSSFISYLAGQNTDRDHYTGIYPDDPIDISKHLSDPPYGYTTNTTLQAGIQFNHRLQDFLPGNNVITMGIEYIFDDVLDTIPAYNYVTDQETQNFGGFLQSDWQITSSLNLLTGLRIDKHNLVDRIIASPRVSLLYRLKNYTQLRLTWSTGFRAPQAFDADMHIAFAGGGVSRISLDSDLKEERSNSISGSVNYNKASKKFIAGFTLEGFLTRLNDAFYLQPIGKDVYGDLFEKRNGIGATVSGGILELRGNYNRILQLEAGFTYQVNLYDRAVETIEGLEPKREFLRTPRDYGYFTLMFTPGDRFEASLSTLYTGSMILAHYSGAPGQAIDEYVESEPFTEINLRLAFLFEFPAVDSAIEIFSGVRNLFNAYQSDFDSGKNRDSGYVYGPAAPRTIFVGLRLKSR
ncbi:MAG: TonB-dependent receptor [Bacteroidota bacterium]